MLMFALLVPGRMRLTCSFGYVATHYTVAVLAVLADIEGRHVMRKTAKKAANGRKKKAL